MIKRISIFYLSAVVVNVLMCWGIALFTDWTMETPLHEADVQAQLQYTFGEDLRFRDGLEGRIEHAAFVRRAALTGWSDEAPSRRYAEQVLKVGWPFTTIRGFGHRRGEAVTYTGALVLSEMTEGGTVRFLPLQPVWPGVILNSLWIALVLWVLAMALARMSRTKKLSG